MAWYRKILGDDPTLMDLIVKELEEVRDTYANARRTKIAGEAGVYTDEDLIAEEDMVVTHTHTGYIKRTPTTEYRAQKRGGRGVTGADTKEEDFVEQLFTASTHDFLLVFTNVGKVYWVKVHELPLGGRTARGKPLLNMIQMGEGEKVSAILPVREFTADHFAITVSKQGTVKKTALSEYSRPRANGIIGAGIAPGDEIIAATVASDEHDVLLGTHDGMAIRFKASDVRAMGRPSVGVRGIRLSAGDEVVGMAVLDPGAAILTVTERGYGKRTRTEEYRIQQRGGKGIILIRVNDKNGKVIGVRQVVDETHVMVITSRGVVIRMLSGDISMLGRNTQGVRLVRLDDEDRVQAVCNLEEADGEETARPVETAADVEPVEPEPEPELEAEEEPAGD